MFTFFLLTLLACSFCLGVYCQRLWSDIQADLAKRRRLEMAKKRNAKAKLVNSIRAQVIAELKAEVLEA